jgi:amino acid transporter
MKEKEEKDNRLHHKIFKKERRIIKYELSHFDKILIAILALVGSAMIFVGAKGILEKLDIFRDPVVMLVAGILILFVTGSFIKISYKKE